MPAVVWIASAGVGAGIATKTTTSPEVLVKSTVARVPVVQTAAVVVDDVVAAHSREDETKTLVIHPRSSMPGLGELSWLEFESIVTM